MTNTNIANTQFIAGKRYTQTLMNPKTFKNERWTYEVEKRDVIVMAISGKYAMVRRPKYYPYICKLKDLS